MIIEETFKRWAKTQKLDYSGEYDYDKMISFSKFVIEEIITDVHMHKRVASDKYDGKALDKYIQKTRNELTEGDKRE